MAAVPTGPTAHDDGVPLAHSLLADDAPGYAGEGAGELGPLCWKCAAPKRARPAPDAPGTLPTGQGGRGAGKPCPVCKGQGRLPPTQRRRKQLGAPAVPPLVGRPAGWASPGPAPVTAESVTAASLGADEQLVSLVGDWRIIQRRAGHRWTTDDLVTAWAGMRAARDAAADAARASGPPPAGAGAASVRPLRCLDLGTGNGTVLLMVAHAFPDAVCVGVEAREEALALARRSIAHNLGAAPEEGAADAAAGGGARVRVVRADLRDTAALDALVRGTAAPPAAQPPPPGRAEASAEGDAPAAGRAEAEARGLRSAEGPDGELGFDLVTGTPPYWLVTTTAAADITAAPDADGAPAPPAGRARLSTFAREGALTTSAEDAPARCCFRGTVAAYCAAAARCLSRSPRARFAVCESAAHDSRVLNAVAEAGLEVVARLSLHGREGKPALLRVWTMRRPADEAGRLATVAAAERAGRHRGAGGALPPWSWAEEAVAVRGADERWSGRYCELMEEMGIPARRDVPVRADTDGER